MSNISNRPTPTMKSISSVPRSSRGRNFLNENKVSLSTLEKSTSKKLAAKEPVRPAWMPTPMRRSDPEVRESKGGKPPPVSVSRQSTRETSMTRNRNNSRSHYQLGVDAPESGQRFGGFEKRNPVVYDPQKDVVHSPDNYTERCNSCGIQHSSTSIGIQTEDITDERFLTKALQKCSFDGGPMLSELTNKYENNYKQSSRYDKNEDEDLLSPRTNGKQQQHSRFNMNELQIDLKTEVASDEESSARGAGSCWALNSAQKRYDVLINELNHMPITSQTMRVRSRKAEIDKELAIVDEEIRVYSKPNLYINSTKYK
ncbi:GL14160 [Drosophila persimilis]|uniref:GL14160 n=1 Tax=Drosophila persimilis TaxID=7234 RepID=B4GU27_DROPE|nr:GL14160 [Drosophila persimilis]